MTDVLLRTDESKLVDTLAATPDEELVRAPMFFVHDPACRRGM